MAKQGAKRVNLHLDSSQFPFLSLGQPGTHKPKEKERERERERERGATGAVARKIALTTSDQWTEKTCLTCNLRVSRWRFLKKGLIHMEPNLALRVILSLFPLSFFPLSFFLSSFLWLLKRKVLKKPDGK